MRTLDDGVALAAEVTIAEVVSEKENEIGLGTGGKCR
jgi:hypothetical protein